jgi:hypothetical protein
MIEKVLKTLFLLSVNWSSFVYAVIEGVNYESTIYELEVLCDRSSLNFIIKLMNIFKNI